MQNTRTYFSDPKEKMWLENLLHPLIRQYLAQQVALCTHNYCVIEIPLLVDKKPYPYLNRILLVTAPTEVQIARIMQRDSSTQEQAKAILVAQPSHAQRLKHADDLLNNDSGIIELSLAVKKLHEFYIKAATGA